MAIISPDDNGEVGGFEKFPVGNHAVVFKEFKHHVKDKETLPLVMWLSWNHIDNENMNISQYIDFSQPRGIKDFVTALKISGIADKIKAVQPGVFGGASGYDIDDDRILEKANGVPVKVRDNFIMAIRNIANGTVVGVHAEEDKNGYIKIKKYLDINKIKTGGSGGSQTQNKPSMPPKPEYNF